MTSLTQKSAEVVALEGLSWLVGSDELLPIFLGSTGASESDLKRRAGDSDFLASVLDFLLLNDEWISEFCRSAGYTYDMPMRARAALPGGATVNWT